jgi:hypothetical protein
VVEQPPLIHQGVQYRVIVAKAHDVKVDRFSWVLCDQPPERFQGLRWEGGGHADAGELLPSDRGAGNQQHRDKIERRRGHDAGQGEREQRGNAIPSLHRDRNKPNHRHDEEGREISVWLAPPKPKNQNHRPKISAATLARQATMPLTVMGAESFTERRHRQIIRASAAQRTKAPPRPAFTTLHNRDSGRLS